MDQWQKHELPGFDRIAKRLHTRKQRIGIETMRFFAGLQIRQVEMR